MTAAGSYTYGYDADGNRTGVTLSGSTTTSTFDYEDRLTGIGANVTYSYIGAGTDRYNKTVSGTTTQFLYDGGSVDEEMQSGVYTAIYGAAAEKLSGTLYWMLQDGQGSTRQLLNTSQATVASYTTDAYGNSVSSSGTAANPFQWNGGSGYYSDSESGLQKVGARYYEPATGRWISQDSLLVAGSPADSQAVNRYLYCGANPVGGADSTGHVEGYAYAVGAAIAVGAIIFGWHMYLEWLADRSKDELYKWRDYGKRVNNDKLWNQDNHPADPGPVAPPSVPTKYSQPPGGIQNWINAHRGH
jgi:RHS repeat-associated protein